MIAAMDERSYIAGQLELCGLQPTPQAFARDTGVKIDGLQFHLREWGAPSAHPVVFLHGGGGGARDWDPICAVLSSRHSCIAVDQRGHGDSDWSRSGDYRLDAFASDLKKLAAALRWESVRFVGFSMGGANALAAGAAMGKQFRALVLLEAAPRLHHDAMVERLRARIGSPRRYASLEEAIDRRGDVDAELARAYQARRLRQRPDGFWEPKHDPRLLNGAGMRESPDEREAALWRAVSVVQCPVLIIRGGRSSLLGARAATELASRFADAQVVEIATLPHRISAHGAPELVEVLASFLEAHDSV